MTESWLVSEKAGVGGEVVAQIGQRKRDVDLNQARRETLLEIIAELGQRVGSLEARLSGGGRGSGMPGHKPAARRKNSAADQKKLRMKRQHGFARLRMETTRRVVHAPEACPECYTSVPGG